jgi:RNA polymerase sigma-70 factor (ECF subfamily)
LTAFERRGSCRGSSDRERAAWLFTIAANKLAGHFRRGASERRATDQLAGELRALSRYEIAVIQQLVESGDRVDGVRAAFDGLSGKQQEAVRLRVIDEQPYDVLSAQLGISEPAARARVSRGLRAMRRAIVREPERNSK